MQKVERSRWHRAFIPDAEHTQHSIEQLVDVLFALHVPIAALQQ